MLKKVNSVLNIVIGSVIGVFIGRGIQVFWDLPAEEELRNEIETQKEMFYLQQKEKQGEVNRRQEKGCN